MTAAAEQDAASTDASAPRRASMALLARASEAELETALAGWQPRPNWVSLRRPEAGLVMVRGRIGGDGGPFNVGEATVTRAAVRLEGGPVGHAYLLGRAPRRAELAALFDALWQHEATRAGVEERVLAPVRARIEADRRREAARTAATRVNFFTMVRGENAGGEP